MAINAHPLEKVKRAVSAGGECGNVYFLHPCACPQRRLRQGLILVHQALRKSKCENAAEATGFCTMSLSDCWFCLFEGVGINSQDVEDELPAGRAGVEGLGQRLEPDAIR
jgi:hypothetical protein